MRQATMTAPGVIEYRDVPEPSAGPGEVLLRIRRIGICGSDVHVAHGQHPFTGYPVIQGHEFSATVEAVGEGVHSIQPGSKVTAIPQLTCGACAPCRRGDSHICDQLQVEGFQAPGVARDLFVTKAEKIVPLPERFTFEQGAMVEPVAVAVHAASRAGTLAGRNVVVLGAGPIGNLTGQVVRARGSQVLITDLSEHRLTVAKRCGLANVSNARLETLRHASRRVFGDGGFDVAFECVGSETTMTAAVEAIAKGGTIVIVGVFADEPRIAMGLVQDRELTLTGTLMYQYDDYCEAVRLIDLGEVVTEPLESRHFPFGDYAAAYRFIAEHGARSMKVFIDL